MKHRKIIVILLAAGIGGAGILPAMAVTQSESYTGPGVLTQCKGADLTAGLVPAPGPNIRSGVNSPFQLGGCFKVPPGQATYDLGVKDASGTTPAIAVNYQYADGSGVLDSKGNTVQPMFCGGQATGVALPPPDKSAGPVVFLNAFQLDPAQATLDGCKKVGGVPTSGTITVTYHKPPPPQKQTKKH